MHGYLSCKESFIKQIRFFERDYEVFAFDFKGFGDNKGMEYPYSLDDYVIETKEYFYKKGLKSPSVIAHSFGGRVAIKSAYTDKNFFSKIVLTGSAGLKPKKTLSKEIKTKTFKVLSKFIKKERLRSFYSKDYLSLDDVMKESFIKIVNEHLDNLLGGIYNKTLIINGKNDRETPLYMAKRLNLGIKNSKLVIIENAGHFCFIDKSDKFNMEVREFLLSK